MSDKCIITYISAPKYDYINKELISIQLQKYLERIKKERFLWTINIDLDNIDYVCMHIKQIGIQVMNATLSRHVTQSLAYQNDFISI